MNPVSKIENIAIAFINSFRSLKKAEVIYSPKFMSLENKKTEIKIEIKISRHETVADFIDLVNSKGVLMGADKEALQLIKFLNPHLANRLVYYINNKTVKNFQDKLTDYIVNDEQKIYFEVGNNSRFNYLNITD